MTDGIYTDITIEDYHANKTHVSATTLKYAKESLKHYDWYRNGKLENPTGSHFSFGNAFELALLSPDEYVKKVAIMPENDWLEEIKELQPDVKTWRNTTIQVLIAHLLLI